MNITFSNINDVLISSDAFNIDSDVHLSNSLSDTDIIRLLDHIVSCEKANANVCVHMHCNDFSTSQIINVYKWFFSNPYRNDIRNVSLILNVLNIMNTYNTFDDSFFSCNDIFVNSIEQMLDVKSAVLDDIQTFCKDICECYLSMLRSISKYEYSELDDYVEIPVLYKVIFNSIDMLTLSGLLTNVDDTCQLTFKKYKFADKYVLQMCKSYVMSNVMISNIMNKNEQIN